MQVYAVLTGVTFLSTICTVTGKLDGNSNTDSYLTTMEIIRKYGYPAEAHTVETADGYLLTIHRIPNGKGPHERRLRCSKNAKPPILMVHGFTGSSADFLILASKSSLAFLLADQGYDVWLGNLRGNRYGRAHTSLFPDTRAFWNFTWHESGIYDVPAQIEFICNHTQHEKLVYVGFSLGATTFFALMSTLPQWNEKIHVSMLMAPVAYAKNIKSVLLRFLSVFSGTFNDLIEITNHGEFPPDSTLFRKLKKLLCTENDIERRLCISALFLIFGSDPKEFDKNLLPVLINNFLTGYSSKGMNHYAQLVKSGKFQQYDYGREGNLLQYGTPTPPEYNLSSIQTPMYFYVGKNDFLSTLRDVNHLAKQLSSLKKLQVIEYENFTHTDFLFSIHVKEFVYDILINDLNTSLTKQGDHS